MNFPPYPLEVLDPSIEVRVGHLAGLLLETTDWADGLFVHYPGDLPDKLRKPLQAFARKQPDLSFLLRDAPMPCGTGACLSCAISLKEKWVLQCTAGPFLSINLLKI